MKRRLKAEREEMERAAIVIQMHTDAEMLKLVANMKKRRLREIEEENNAALIQLAWRRKKDKWSCT